MFLKEVLVAWWHGGEKNNTPYLSGVCVKTVQALKQTTNDKSEKKNINKPKRNVICCKSECINHMLRNQCFVNIRSTYCKTYHKNNNCNEYTLKSFLQEKAKYIYTLAQHAMYNQVYPIICLICL